MREGQGDAPPAILNPVSDRVLTFYVSSGDGVDGVYKVDRGIPYQWTLDGWMPQHFDYSGVGGATEYDTMSVEEAVQALLDRGVSPDQANAAILGADLLQGF